eukprot:6212744-Pleurochrysis_carterae.AAC.4
MQDHGGSCTAAGMHHLTHLRTFCSTSTVSISLAAERGGVLADVSDADRVDVGVATTPSMATSSGKRARCRSGARREPSSTRSSTSRELSCTAAKMCAPAHASPSRPLLPFLLSALFWPSRVAEAASDLERGDAPLSAESAGAASVLRLCSDAVWAASNQSQKDALICASMHSSRIQIYVHDEPIRRMRVFQPKERSAKGF